MRGAIFILLLCCVVSTAIAVDNASHSLDKVSDAYNARKLTFNNVWVKYRVNEFISRHHFRKTAHLVYGDAPRPKGKEYKDVRFTLTAEYVRKGDLVRTAGEGPSVEDGELKPSPGLLFHVYNGRRTVQYEGEKRYTITSKPEAAKSYATPWDLCGETALRRNLEDVSTRKGILKASSLTLDLKSQAQLLELRFASGWWNRGQLIPELGYSIRQYEVFNRQNLLAYRYHGIEYGTVDGIPYPTRATLTIYDGNEQQRVVSRESQLEVISITLNRGAIPSSLFEVEIPQDARIYDKDQGKYVRNPERVQVLLDEIAAESPRRRERRLWAWLAAGAVAALALGGGVWFWRRRRRPALS